MPFQPCFHRCRGECIADRRGGCAVSCHPASAYVPPRPDSPVGRYLALVNATQARLRAALPEETTDGP